jgi:hypothetical protein
MVKSVTDAHLVGAGYVGSVLEAPVGSTLQWLLVVILPPNLCVKICSSSVFTTQGILVTPMWSVRDMVSLNDSWCPPEPDTVGAGAWTVYTLTLEGPIAATVAMVGAGSNAQVAR